MSKLLAPPLRTSHQEIATKLLARERSVLKSRRLEILAPWFNLGVLR